MNKAELLERLYGIGGEVGEVAGIIARCYTKPVAMLRKLNELYNGGAVIKAHGIENVEINGRLYTIIEVLA